MNKVVFTWFLLGSLVVLQAKELNNVTNQQWLKDLQTLVSLSDKKVDALSGIDKDKDGVRDDVESYILSKYADDPFQRDMFYKAAKKIQKIISLPLHGQIDEHIKLDRELLEVYTCRDYILYRNESQDIEQELLNKTLFKGKVLNTSQRLKAYIEHKKILPAHFDDLSEKEMSIDKHNCLSLYNSYQEVDTKSTTLNIR
jgi:hypothetical protein